MIHHLLQSWRVIEGLASVLVKQPYGGKALGIDGICQEMLDVEGLKICPLRRIFLGLRPAAVYAQKI